MCNLSFTPTLPPSCWCQSSSAGARAEIDADQAAVFFQKLWKGFKTKKEAGRLRDEELILIGMKEAPQRPTEDDPLVRQNKVCRLLSLLRRLQQLAEHRCN